mmetsp:Transcript_10866/g.18855  ORF Transcript_10866/g.18855 Transcript_10866/m.18855 type:complete len:331 (+) Transcript_10866:127-1119(+)
MDGMESMASMFSSMLPYASPFMCVNMSGTCATSRLIQLRQMGCSTCSVERKIEKESGPRQEQLDWLGMHQVVNQVHAMADKRAKTAGSAGEFVCILFQWQQCEGAATRASDFGGLVFTDMTGTRFLVIETAHQDSTKARSRRQADSLFSVLTYIGYKPKWIRHVTMIPCRGDVLPKGLLESQGSLEDGSYYGEVNQSNFVPSLTEMTMDKIDVIIGRDKSVQSHVQKDRESLGISLQALRASVTVPKPRYRRADMPADQLAYCCSHCKQTAAEAGVSALLTCGRCKIARYCNKKHQAAHWREHKIYCSAKADATHADQMNAEPVNDQLID